VAPLALSQEEFFAGASGPDRWRQLPALIERLSSRLGEKAVLRPRLWPDAQPEYACRLEPWTQISPRPKADGQEPGTEPAPPRPPCLKPRPISLPVVPLTPGGPPQRFQWNGQVHTVAHCWGPERIETGWWRGKDVRRDYYLVETTNGRRFWLFRTIGGESWFLHGTFA
jgi:protein ImuB